MTSERNPGELSASHEDIISATEALFLDIAKNSDAGLQGAVKSINSRRRLIRMYEVALIPDREDELAALRACWAARNIPQLKALLVKYYQRRHELAPQIVALMNATSAPQ